VCRLAKPSALLTLVPHTTSLRRSRFEVQTRTPFLKPGAFDAQGLVTIPLAKLMRPIGELRAHELKAVEGAVCAWLGIAESSPRATPP
jgi:mRNA interferase MazF